MEFRKEFLSMMLAGNVGFAVRDAEALHMVASPAVLEALNVAYTQNLSGGDATKPEFEHLMADYWDAQTMTHWVDSWNVEELGIEMKWISPADWNSNVLGKLKDESRELIVLTANDSMMDLCSQSRVITWKGIMTVSHITDESPASEQSTH